MPKRGRRLSSLMFAVVLVGTFFLLTLECDCFHLLPVTVDKNRVNSRQGGCIGARKYSSTVVALLKSDDDVDDSRSGATETETETKSLSELLSPMSSCKVDQMSGTDLAYIGDVVFELFIRSRHVWPSKRTSDLQNIVVGIVRGASFDRLID